MQKQPIPAAVMSAAQDLMLLGMQMNNETTHAAFVQFHGHVCGLHISVLREKKAGSQVIYDNSMVYLDPCSYRTEAAILRQVEQVEADLTRIMENDYATQCL